MFRKLFGRKPRRPDPEALLQTIAAFINAKTWSESQRLVEQHPELLSDQADALLGQLVEAAQAQSDENARRTFEQHRALLRRCREVGVEKAFAALTPPPAADAASPSPLPESGRGEGGGVRACSRPSAPSSRPRPGTKASASSSSTPNC